MHHQGALWRGLPGPSAVTGAKAASNARWPPRITASRWASPPPAPTATIRRCWPPPCRPLTASWTACCPTDRTCHLNTGYDSSPTRQTLAGLGFTGQIARRGTPAPLQAGRRWPVERTHSWMNGFGKLHRMTDRIGAIFSCLASHLCRAAIVTSTATTCRCARPAPSSWDTQPHHRRRLMMDVDYWTVTLLSWRTPPRQAPLEPMTERATSRLVCEDQAGRELRSMAAAAEAHGAVCCPGIWCLGQAHPFGGTTHRRSVVTVAL